MSRYNGSAVVSIVLVSLSFLDFPRDPVSPTPASTAASSIVPWGGLYSFSKSGTTTIELGIAATDTCASKSSVIEAPVLIKHWM